MVLLDCETTGGKAIYHRIIEIGALELMHHELIETWQTFIDPKVALPPFIQRLTGITPSMVNGAPEFADLLKNYWVNLKAVPWSPTTHVLTIAF